MPVKQIIDLGHTNGWKSGDARIDVFIQEKDGKSIKTSEVIYSEENEKATIYSLDNFDYEVL